MKEYLFRPTILISTVYLLLALLHFSPVAIAYKLAFPLAFLTLCALRYTSWPMVLAMGFSALGDYMGVCHNFWGQMGAFALAHAAYILFFCRTNPAERTSDGMKWKSAIVVLYGVVIGIVYSSACTWVTTSRRIGLYSAHPQHVYLGMETEEPLLCTRCLAICALGYRFSLE